MNLTLLYELMESDGIVGTWQLADYDVGKCRSDRNDGKCETCAPTQRKVELRQSTQHIQLYSI